jgi:hypothetical protein
MPKRKLIDIANEYDMEFDEALMLVTDKLPKDQVTGKGRGTWIGKDGQDILHSSLMIPEITPKHYKGQVTSECPNKRYNYIYSKDLGKKVPVLIPAKFRGKMIGKIVTFEAIEDGSGVTYRYVKA